MQTVRLNEGQGQELCDEIANLLLNTLDSQNIDHKIEAAINVFLTKNKLDADAAELANKLSWSVKVGMER